jgi:hypothetical protein
MKFVMHKISKVVCWITLYLIVWTFSSGARLAARHEDLPKSPLEAFATRSTAKVSWSKMKTVRSQEAALFASLTISFNKGESPTSPSITGVGTE